MKLRRLLEMCIVQHVKATSVITIQTKNYFFNKKSEARCRVPHIPLNEQKPTLTLFGGDGTNCFAKQTSPNYTKPSEDIDEQLKLSHVVDLVKQKDL